MGAVYSEEWLCLKCGSVNVGTLCTSCNELPLGGQVIGVHGSFSETHDGPPGPSVIPER